MTQTTEAAAPEWRDAITVQPGDIITLPYSNHLRVEVTDVTYPDRPGVVILHGWTYDEDTRQERPVDSLQGNQSPVWWIGSVRS